MTPHPVDDAGPLLDVLDAADETGFRADVYLVGVNERESWALEHRRPVDVGTRRVWGSPPEYLIAYKLEYRTEGGSETHVRDVRAMLAVSGDAIARALLADLVARRGVRAQWDEVVAPAAARDFDRQADRRAGLGG